METHIHPLTALFDQLGLKSNDEDIQKFIHQHRPIPRETELHKAGFWSPSQASFLEQALDEDADWAEVVDQLNIMLRAPRE
jgi:hypothetical protein